MLKRVRDILDMISTCGFSHDTVFQVMNKLQQPTFEEFFALLILMKYYFHQDFDITSILVEFYRRFRDRISAQYPNDDDARRMWLIRTNTAIIASQLKNETDLEIVTKNAIRELFN